MHARIMLGLLLVFQLADAATFVFGVGLHGIELESNGFASLAYQWHGLDGVLILKGAAILLTLAVLVAGATGSRGCSCGALQRRPASGCWGLRRMRIR